MYKDLLAHYLTTLLSKIQPEIIFGTRNGYEFTMGALFVNGEWYAVVEHPDASRIDDINEIIEDEFDATVKGWCVLKKYHAEVGAEAIDFSLGEQEYWAITYKGEQGSCWLLRIEPNTTSRLLAESHPWA